MQNKQFDIILRRNHKNFHKRRLFTLEYAHHPEPKSTNVLIVYKYTKVKRVRKRRHMDGGHTYSIHSSNFLKNKSPKIKCKLKTKQK